LLHDTASMLRVLHQAQQLYLKHGYAEEAASVYPSIIDIYISRDSLEAAKKLMDVFEAKSGLFDAKGNISAGRENYYELKGLYHIKNNKLDSAEFCFRRLMQFHLITGAYRGLFSVYKGRMNTDSIVKYAQLYEDAVNHEQETLRTQTVHQMSSLYNYQRFLKEADAESKRAARLKYYFLLSIFFVSVVIFAGILIGIIQAHKRKSLAKETERLKKDYTEAVAKKEQLAVEMEILKVNHEQLKTSEQEAKSMIEVVNANNNQLLKTKEREIAELNEKIREYAGRLLHTSKNVGNRPQLDLLVEDFHGKATRKKNMSLPNRKEWEQLVSLFATIQPEAYVAIGRDLTLSAQELKACILLLLKFSNGEIISLLDISSQGMTNIRARINEKLFGEPKASNLAQNLKKIPLV